MKPLLFLFLTLIFLTGVIQAQAPARGYQARACGFDLDDDGTVAGAGDCDICDGATADPDGDGDNELLNYVDSAAIVDNTTCGASDAPCKTIQHVLDSGNSSYSLRLNSSSTVEGIICVKGTHNQTVSINLTEGGIAGNHTNRNSHQYPTNPFMIVGWDGDGDGSYPPFDTDDTAVIDGGGNSKNVFGNGGASYVEIAHLTVNDYIGSKFMSAASDMTHFYYHDLVLNDLGKGQTLGSGTIIWPMFFLRMDWHAIENVNIVDTGYWVWRGASTDTNNWRFSEISYTAYANPSAGIGLMKPWDTISGIVVENSIFDAQPTVWGRTSGLATGVSPSQCSQDITVRNNKFIDWTYAVNIQPFASGFCTTRHITDVVIDGNEFDTNFSGWNAGAIQLDPGDSGTETTFIGVVKIVNNFFHNTVTDPQVVLDRNSKGVSANTLGDITFAGNTISGSYTIAWDDGAALNKINNFTFKNNIFDGTIGKNIEFNFAPSNYVGDGNLFDAGGNFEWNNSNHADIAAWRTASGEGASSKEDCVANLVSSTDLHLDSGDTCAIDAGVDITAITTVDIDRDSRVAVDSDIGADETSGAPPPTTLAKSFTAAVGTVRDSTSHLPAAIGAGDTITGTFTYPTTSPVDRNPDPTRGEYLFNAAPAEVSFSVNDGATTHTWQEATRIQIYVRVRNSTTDSVIITLRGITFPGTVTESSTNINSSIVVIQLADTTGAAKSSDALPTSLTLSNWNRSSAEVIALVPGGHYRIASGNLATLVNQ